MKKHLISVKNVVSGTSTNAEGYPLFLAIDHVISKGEIVVLSLKDSTAMSSSFLNSSIGAVIEKHGKRSLKGKLILKDYTPSMAANIKQYIERLGKMSKA